MFKDRVDAGRRLALRLKKFQNEECVVVAVPRGGVILGEIVALELGCPLDLMLVRKIGHPYNLEYAVCAVSESSMKCSQEEKSNLNKDWLQSEVIKERSEIERRKKLNKKYFSIPISHLSALPLMADYYQNLKLPNLAIATPDLGGTERARLFAKVMGIEKIVVIEKFRPSINSAVTLKITGEVNNKNIILVDDMIQTGGTLFAAAKLLRSKGAKDIYAAVTHCLPHNKGINLLTTTSLFKKILISNSLAQEEKLPPKVYVLDISSLLSKSIARITS